MTEEPRTDEPQTAPAVSVVGPGDGETIVLGTTRMRVLEDGSHTGHRLAIAESVLAPHTFANPTDRPAVMLSTFTPDLYVQYFRDLREALADGRPLTPRADIEAMSRYATEPVTDLA
ncbi:cupin domain-containing protein [Streptomyces sp. NPDC015184]|uniref:cupin domain-containing protein n=1 Tax=Streptomyces sp. NPDC015184 TaxID=3364946 RepID=UPI0036F7AE76